MAIASMVDTTVKAIVDVTPTAMVGRMADVKDLTVA